MTIVTMEIPESLYQRAEEQAVEQGRSLETLMQEALEEYLDELRDAIEAEEILARIQTGEEPLVSWEAFQALASSEDREDVIGVIAAKRATERGEERFYDLDEIQAELDALQR